MSISIGLRVDPEMYDALDRAAQEDERPASQLVRKILRAWLIEHGFLGQDAAPDLFAAQRKAAGRR